MTEEDLERRAGSHGGTTDGSGDWGAQADDRGITDRANHYMWTRVALAAEAMGLTNAARHMRHYLGNTGNPLTVNVDAMLRDVPPFREAHARQLDVARRRVNDHLARMGRTDEAASFQIEGERLSDVYCRESISRDWFFAIGGFTYWYTADVTVTPLPLQVVPGQMAPSVSTAPRVRMEFRLHVFDRYNWDQGKSVTIAGITVTDEQLGRLHRVGLAREYEIHGVSSPTTVEWVFSDNTTAPGQPEVPQAEARDGGRTDPTRDRGRHFDNIRGSEGSNR